MPALMNTEADPAVGVPGEASVVIAGVIIGRPE
jgi:hypothetical protein